MLEKKEMISFRLCIIKIYNVKTVYIHIPSFKLSSSLSPRPYRLDLLHHEQTHRQIGKAVLHRQKCPPLHLLLNTTARASHGREGRFESGVKRQAFMILMVIIFEEITGESDCIQSWCL